MRAMCWVQRDQTLIGGVSWRRDNNIVNNSWSVDAVRHEGNQSSIVEGAAGHELMIIDPMKW